MGNDEIRSVDLMDIVLVHFWNVQISDARFDGMPNGLQTLSLNRKDTKQAGGKLSPQLYQSPSDCIRLYTFCPRL